MSGIYCLVYIVRYVLSRYLLFCIFSRVCFLQICLSGIFCPCIFCLRVFLRVYFVEVSFMLTIYIYIYICIYIYLFISLATYNETNFSSALCKHFMTVEKTGEINMSLIIVSSTIPAITICLMPTGTLFQAVGPAVCNARSPNWVLVLSS